MNTDDIERMKKSAAEWLVKYTSLESREVAQRCLDGTATTLDRIDFAMNEMREAMEVLPPSAPDNGRGGKYGDGFHAGCCALRAWGELIQLRKMLVECEPARAVRDVAWLIEDNNVALYWCGGTCLNWGGNERAIRFARKQDAEAAMAWLGLRNSAKVTEHMWVGSKESV